MLNFETRGIKRTPLTGKGPGRYRSLGRLALRGHCFNRAELYAIIMDHIKRGALLADEKMNFPTMCDVCVFGAYFEKIMSENNQFCSV